MQSNIQAIRARRDSMNSKAVIGCPSKWLFCIICGPQDQYQIVTRGFANANGFTIIA